MWVRFMCMWAKVGCMGDQTQPAEEEIFAQVKRLTGGNSANENLRRKLGRIAIETLDDPRDLIIDGMPDGLSVDTGGGVWSAFWLGGTVIRFDPDGDRDRTVEFTARRTTAITFGGDDYGTGYVTSGCLDSREVDGEGAGSLFTFDPGATGREEFRSDVEV